MKPALLTLSLILFVGPVGAQGQDAASPPPESPQTPHFQEVLRLLRGNLVGVTEEELNRAMVEGLINHFQPRVQLVSTNEAPATAEDLILRSATYETSIGYIGLRRVEADLANQLSSTLQDLAGTNKLQGLILDLRSASGDDYAAVAAAASLFVRPGQPLLQWDDQTLQSSPPGGEEVPLAVLVNQATSGAAEALAGALKATGPAVVIGSRTAGRAFAMRTLTLENGQQLRVAGAPVEVGEGRPLTQGVEPDLELASQPERDLLWMEDPYKVQEGSAGIGTTSRPRFDEAELVRRHEGLTNPPALGAAPNHAPPQPALQDPSLVRALAVLKALNRVRGGIRR